MQEMSKLAVDDRSAIFGSIAGCTLLFAALLTAKLMWPVQPHHAKPNCPALEQGTTACRPR